MSDTAKAEIDYQPIRTEGKGDCAFHATLGEWDDSANMVLCRDIIKVRETVAEAIRRAKSEDKLFELIESAIGNMLMDENRAKLPALKIEYEIFLKENEEEINEAWEIFNKELKNHPDVKETAKYLISKLPIDKFQNLKTFNAQFIACLDLEEGLLRGLILSITKLQEAFEQYNKKTNEAFQLREKLTKNKKIIEQYANYIQTQGNWLLPIETEIIAYVFDITVEFYTYNRFTRKRVGPVIYNTGKSQNVKICFNGVNHFEKMSKHRIEYEAKSQAEQSAQESAPIPAVPTALVTTGLTNKWSEDLIAAFLKLELIAHNKAYKIDVKLIEKEDITELEKVLREAGNELIAIKDKLNSDCGILIFRILDDNPIIFRIGIESSIEKKSKKKTYRLFLEIYCNCFLTDIVNNLRSKSWDDSIACIEEYFDSKTKKTKKQESLQKLIYDDFLQSLDAELKITRIRLFSVASVDSTYQETMCFYKLLNVLEIEIAATEKQNLALLHDKYLYTARQAFIRDAGVAKAQQGFAYQEHLVMLLSYLAVKSEQEFSLLAEAMVQEALNDVLFEWDDQLIFIQQKHRSAYSSSVPDKYRVSEVLDGKAKEDPAILKYYYAYKKLKADILDIKHPLHKYQDKLASGKIKIIFFTNRIIPVEDLEGDIKFKKVNLKNQPLHSLPDVNEIIEGEHILKISKLEAKTLGLKEAEQEEIDNFCRLFYLFHRQKNAEQLLQLCNKIILLPTSNFGKTTLARNFAHYIHRWFISEDPTYHVFTREVIQEFFDNHERYHYNLVKYSCYLYPTKKLEHLITTYKKQLNKLHWLQTISSAIIDQNIIRLYSDNPFVAAAIVQELFPASERQILTPVSPGLHSYDVTSEIKFLVIVGDDELIRATISKINKYNKKKTSEESVKIIRIISELHDDTDYDLNIKAKELGFLHKEYPELSILLPEADFCLTDLLLFVTTEFANQLSSDERATFVPQRLDSSEIVLPYDKLETNLYAWRKENYARVASSWHLKKEDGRDKLRCEISIKLPKFLEDNNTVNHPKNTKFKLDKDNKVIVYTCNEMDFIAPIIYPNKIKPPVNLEELELQIEAWLSSTAPFSDDKYQKYPDAWKYVVISLEKDCELDETFKTTTEKWRISKNRNKLFYYPFGPNRRCFVEWQEVYSEKSVEIVEAEAGCGKTWFLRDKITLDHIFESKKIPVFIRIKDLVKIKLSDNLLPELLRQSGITEHNIRIFSKQPTLCNLLLDGFDELQESFSQFEILLNFLIKKGCSVIITVRDYKVTTLHSNTSAIVMQSKLNAFNDEESLECMQKNLSHKFSDSSKSVDVEIIRLRDWLKQQDDVNKWLGIPLHVALICEWYVYNRDAFLKGKTPSIVDVYSFLVKHRVARNILTNNSNIYKCLYIISWKQIFYQEQLGILAIKQPKFKGEIKFNLERTGLLRNPYDEEPELFHRTFAEFLIARYFLLKCIKFRFKNDEYNLALIKTLAQNSYQIVNRFFLESLNVCLTDPDIPYEIEADDIDCFRRKWLIDVTERELAGHASAKVQQKQILLQDHPSADDRESSGSNTEEEDGVDYASSALPEVLEDKHKETLQVYDKNKSKAVLLNLFNVYSRVTNLMVREKLLSMIRKINILAFIRNDYPKPKSFFDEYSDINDFDIAKIKAAFHAFEEVSKRYSWKSNNDSHAFNCWSHGGYHDQDFAMPVLEGLGMHINIINLLFIRLYVDYGGYSTNDRSRLINLAVMHPLELKERCSLETHFCSALLFLIMVDDWKQTKEQPKLPRTIIVNLINSFEKLLMASRIAVDAKLFIYVLLIDFMVSFNIRGYVLEPKQQYSQFCFIFQDGFTKSIMLDPHIINVNITSAIYKQLGEQKEQNKLKVYITVWESLTSKMQDVPDTNVFPREGSLLLQFDAQVLAARAERESKDSNALGKRNTKHSRSLSF